MRERCWRTFSASCKMDSNEAGVTHAMPLFVIGFCYSSPLACGSADALSNIQWLSVADIRENDRIERKDCRQ